MRGLRRENRREKNAPVVLSLLILTHHGASFGGAVLRRAAADAAVRALFCGDEDGRVRTEARELDRSFSLSSSSGKRLPQSVHFPGPLFAGGAGASTCCSDEGEDASAARKRKRRSRIGARSGGHREGIVTKTKRRELLLSDALVREPHSVITFLLLLHPLFAEKKQVRRSTEWLCSSSSLRRARLSWSQTSRRRRGEWRIARSQALRAKCTGLGRATRRHWRGEGNGFAFPFLSSLFRPGALLGRVCFLFFVPRNQTQRVRSRSSHERRVGSKRRRQERRKKEKRGSCTL